MTGAADSDLHSLRAIELRADGVVAHQPSIARFENVADCGERGHRQGDVVVLSLHMAVTDLAECVALLAPVDSQPPVSSGGDGTNERPEPAHTRAARRRPLPEPHRAYESACSYQRSTRSARKVFHRLGRPSPSSISIGITPG